MPRNDHEAQDDAPFYSHVHTGSAGAGFYWRYVWSGSPRCPICGEECAPGCQVQPGQQAAGVCLSQAGALDGGLSEQLARVRAAARAAREACCAAPCEVDLPSAQGSRKRHHGQGRLHGHRQALRRAMKDHDVCDWLWYLTIALVAVFTIVLVQRG